MLTKFFAQDNATAKLSSILTLVAAILTLAAPNLPVDISVILLIFGGLFTVFATFFQNNKVYTNSAWLTLAYLGINYLIDEKLAFPNAKEILVMIAGIITALTSFTAQKPGDAKPPKTDQ